MSVKPWQVVVMVAGLGAGAFGVMSAMKGTGPEIPDGVLTVDVATGQLYYVKTPPPFFLPLESPETGEATIWPVEEDEGGGYHIKPRYLGVFLDGEVEGISTDVLQDMTTGEITTNGRKAETLQR